MAGDSKHSQSDSKRGGKRLVTVTLYMILHTNLATGDCSFCLDGLVDSSATAETLDLVQLPCHHCFHW